MRRAIFSLALLALVLSGIFTTSFAQEDFSPDVIAQLSFRETFKEEAQHEDPSDLSSEYAVFWKHFVSVATRASTKGIEITDADVINPDTTWSLEVGGLSMEGTLGDDPNYAASPTGKVSVTIPINNDLGDSLGTLVIAWTAAEVKFTLTLKYQVLADDGFPTGDLFTGISPIDADLHTGEEDPAYAEDLSFGFTFAGREIAGYTAYAKGTLDSYDTTVGDDFFGLSNHAISGATDITKPKVAIVTPGSSSTVTDKPYTITGTCSDDHGKPFVEVQVNGGAWQNALVTPAGTWSLANITFVADNPATSVNEGINNIVVKAIDARDLETVLPLRKFTFLATSTLTVTATGGGSGKVNGPPAIPQALVYAANTLPAPTKTAKHKEGEAIILTAVPNVGSVFDGWTSNKFALTEAEAISPTLKFKFVANPTITAKFIPNPFIVLKGNYNGLISSATAIQRGFFNATLDALGGFTATSKIGALTVTVRGKFSNTGHYTGTAKVGTTIYTVSLDLVGAEGARQITGQISGGGLTASFSGDRGEFDATHPNPFEGTHNVLFTAASANTDVNYPVGIGWGRVVVTKAGLATYTGGLGDNTRFSIGRPLAKSGEWPFFYQLYTNKGSIAGQLKFSEQATTSLTGTLDWFKSAGIPSQKQFAEGFSGQSDVVGVKWTAPVAKERLIFKTTGAGVLSIDAPAAVLNPGTATAVNLPVVAIDADTTLAAAPTNKFTLPVDARLLKLTVTPTSGLFTGSFTEMVNNKPVAYTFSGAILPPKGTFPGSGGATFVRGNRTGSAQVSAAP